MLAESQKKEVSRKCRAARRQYHARQASQLESARQRCNHFEIFKTANEICDTQISRQDNAPLENKKGQLINEAQGKAEIFASYFEELYSVKKPKLNLEQVQEDLASIKHPNIGECVLKTELIDNEMPPTDSEITAAIRDLKTRKSAGADKVTPEHFKCIGINTVNWFSEIVRMCWNNSQVPSDWLQSDLYPIFKNAAQSKQGNERTKVNSYRGISLNSVASKIFANVLLNRANPCIERRLHDLQNGFRKNRGTDDAIFILRRVTEELKRNRTPLYIAYI